MCDVYNNVVMCVSVSVWLNICVFVCWDVQTTTLETLEHSLLVMFSSHLHHLQHCILVVGDVVMYAGVCVVITCINWMRLCVLDVQTTRLETLEHNPLVTVLNHLHHLHHWIWDVSDVCVCWLYALIECVCVCWMHRQQHWTRWSAVHWGWSQVTYITYNTGFELWVMCVFVDCMH